MLGMPILLGPIQIALLEMIIDPVCALVFEAEREERRLMQRPPRDPDERLFSLSLVTRSILQGGVALLVLVLILLVADRHMGLEPAELRTLMFLRSSLRFWRWSWPTARSAQESAMPC
jgi:Ca2+-transporting ATPase